MKKVFTGKKAMGAIGSPVALITSSYDGKANVTTVTMLAGLSFSPPLVCISLSHRSYTRGLIDGSGEFAINMVSPDLLDIAKKAGSTSGRKIDKFREFGIGTLPGKVIAGPLVEKAHTVLECKVDKVVDLGNHDLYIATVVAYHDLTESNPLYLHHGRYYTIGEQIGFY